MSARGGFYGGLMLVALVTLMLEVINARLLSVITWYHLAFVAVSIAMLGMTAGAVYVYVRPRRFDDARVPGALVLYSALFAVSVPISHVVLIRFRPGASIGVQEVRALAQFVLMAATMAVPFFLAGVVVAVSLTRVALPIGRVYFFDLLGASAGCLAAIVLMQTVDPSSGSFFLGATAGLAALGYAWDARRQIRPTTWGILAVLTATLAGTGVWNAAVYPYGIRLTHAKGQSLPRHVLRDRWNTHSRVIVQTPVLFAPHYWGPGREAPQTPIRWTFLIIDGEAGTFLNEFSGDDIGQIQWIRHDVTSLAYHLRGQGDVAVIGVGGGRDILTGLAFGCRSVVGIELNGILLHTLTYTFKELCNVVSRPEVTLVHDEGRSFLTRSTDRFDLIQMSLTDTWAATSAGAMTLGENGLYTVEAWQTFLHRLRPQGVLTVSRWFSPDDLSETARLLSLATGALLANGVTQPADHIVLAAAGKVGTLIVCREPFSAADLGALRSAVEHYGFDLIVVPGETPPDRRLARILGATSAQDLAVRTSDPVLDLTPPHDDRPFFFNILRPRAWLAARQIGTAKEGVIQGNLVAGANLLLILAAVSVLVGLSIVLPLVLFGGRHGLGVIRFAAAAHYFAAIGMGFMLLEIGLVQRFSVLLGHPIWSLAIVLCSMILSTGLGSLASDRLRLTSRGRLLLLPAAIAIATAATAAALQPAIDAAIAASLPVRALTALAFTVPVGLLLGVCFPVGLRLVRAHSVRALPWMWGINGGFGVLGGVIAVIVSMAWGISWTLRIGGLCYLSLVLPILLLPPPATQPKQA